MMPATRLEPATDELSSIDLRTPDDVAKPRRTTYNTYVKPVGDRLVALLLIVVLLPVFVVSALAVWASLGRPLLFRQDRVGLGGSVFRVLKLRTMAPDRRRAQVPLLAQNDRRRVHKSADDPRLTRTGRFLRKWSLDELPQLFNVALGHMSLVGPRPELVDVVADYPLHVHARHAVRPGLTGLWQISDRGGELMCENPALDLEYVERQSFLLDVKILLKTPLAVVGSQKGY